MNSINEEKHIGDLGNVAPFVEEIVIAFKYLFYVELNKKIKDKDLYPTFNVQGNLNLSKMTFTPDWLDHDIKIYFDVSVKRNNENKINDKSIIGEFLTLDLRRSNKDINRIEPNDDNDKYPYRLCGYAFRFHKHPYYYKDHTDIEDIFNELRISIGHEIEHAWDEYNFLKGKTPEQIDTIIYDTSDYSEAMSHINSIITEKQKNKQNDEDYNFLYTLYQLTYVERRAFISSFYYEVRPDVKSGNIKNVDEYDIYKDYISNKEYIEKFNDAKLFDEYKDDISKLFGKTTKTVNRLKTKLLVICDSIIKRLDDVYKKAISQVDNIESMFDVSLLDIEYEKYKKKLLNELTDDVSYNESVSYKLNAEKYMLRDFEIIRSILSK